jgi:hypothetical protein
MLLLTRPDVRADLRLDAAQARDAEAAVRALYVRAHELKGKSGAGVIAARRAIDDEQQRWLQSRLSSAQLSRLIQIDLQWEGPAALVSRPAVADALGLTPEQRATLRQAVAECTRTRSEGVFRADDERELARKTLATLSEPQRARWKAMLGRPFSPQLVRAKTTGARPG